MRRPRRTEQAAFHTREDLPSPGVLHRRLLEPPRAECDARQSAELLSAHVVEVRFDAAATTAPGAATRANRDDIVQDAAVQLRKLHVAGYRSFGPDGVDFGPLGHTNVLIGPNNVGKSNVVRFLVWLRRTLFSQYGSWQDIHGPRLMASLTCSPREADWWMQTPKNIDARLELRLSKQERARFPPEALAPNGELVVRVNVSFTRTGPSLFISPVAKDGPILRWNEGKAELLTIGKGWTQDVPNGDAMEPVPSLVCSLLANSLVDVEALRHHSRAARGEAGQPASSSTDGTNTIAALGALSTNPDRRSEWAALRDDLIAWLRPLLNDSHLNFFEVQGPDVVLGFRRGPRTLSLTLDALGTGAAQFVMLLAFLRLHRGTGRIALIEEPEAHLHPAAVVELLRIVRTEMPEHQLILTTHSTSVVDAVDDGWALFRAVKSPDGSTTIRALATTNERLGLLHDLGISPSQMFLANVVVWVEGPSDVIYLRRLLRAADTGNALLEGRSHTFVTYGGALLAHVGLDPEGDSLVKCLRVSPANVVVCDRDASGDEPLKKAVRRLVAEARELHGGQAVQVLPVREVEHLVRPHVLAAALDEHIKTVTTKRGKQSVHFDVRALCGTTSFSKQCADAARVGGRKLSERASATLAKLVEKKKRALARAIVASDDAVFTDEALLFGKQLLESIKSAGREPRAPQRR